MKKTLENTIVHELIHMRFPYLAHGKRFNKLVRQGLRGKTFPPYRKRSKSTLLFDLYLLGFGKQSITMEIAEILPFIAGIASFLVAGGLVAWIVKQPAGTKEMMDISNAVKEGASAFLKREMKIIIPVAIALSLIIGIFLTPSNGIAFAVGAALICSCRNYLIKNYSKSSS